MGAFRACLGKIGRREFIHQPLVRLMRPDGSVVTARCAEPRHLVQLPLNLAKLSDDQRRIVVAGRRGTVQRKREDVIEDTFDPLQYVQKHSSVSTFVAAAVKVTEKKTSDEAKTAKNLKKSTKMEETGDGGEKPQELSKKFQKAMTTAEKAVKEAEKSMKIAQKAMKTAAKEAKKED